MSDAQVKHQVHSILTRTYSRASRRAGAIYAQERVEPTTGKRYDATQGRVLGQPGREEFKVRPVFVESFEGLPWGEVGGLGRESWGRLLE